MKLEERCKIEVESHKQQLEKEYENLMQQFSKELEKLQIRHHQELERRQKQNQIAEKKVHKDITNRHEAERKTLETQQKREYKAYKDKWKKELSQDEMTPKRQRDATLQSQKDSLKQMEAQAEQRLVRGQREYLDLEMRKFRRKRLLSYSALEQELLCEVSLYIISTL